MYEIISYLNKFSLNGFAIGEGFSYFILFLVLSTFTALFVYQIKTFLFLKNRIGTEEKKTNIFLLILQLIPLVGFLFLILNMKSQSADVNKYFEHAKIPEVILKRDLFDNAINFTFSGLVIIALNYLLYIHKINFNQFLDGSQPYVFSLLTLIEIVWFYFMVKMLNRFIRINKIFKLYLINADKKDPKPSRVSVSLTILLGLILLTISIILNIKELSNYKNEFKNVLTSKLGLVYFEKKKIKNNFENKIFKNNNNNNNSKNSINKPKENVLPVIENKPQVVQPKIIEKPKTIVSQLKQDKRILNLWKLLNSNKINFDTNVNIKETLTYNNEKIEFSYSNLKNTNEISLVLDNPSNNLLNDLTKEAEFSKNNKLSEIINNFKNKNKIISIYIKEDIPNNVMNLIVEIDYKDTAEIFNLNLLLKDTLSKNKGFFEINENNLIKIEKDSVEMKKIELSSILNQLSYENVFNGDLYELFIFNLLNKEKTIEYKLTDKLNFNYLNDKNERNIKLKVDNNLFNLKANMNISNLSKDLKEIFIDLEKIDLNNYKSEINTFNFDYKVNNEIKNVLTKIENIKFKEDEIFENTKLLIFNKLIKSLNEDYFKNKSNYLNKKSVNVKLNNNLNIYDFNNKLNIAINSDFNTDDFKITNIENFNEKINIKLFEKLKKSLIKLPLKENEMKEDNIKEDSNLPTNSIPSHEKPILFKEKSENKTETISEMKEPKLEIPEISGGKELPPMIEEPKLEMPEINILENKK